MGWGPDADRLAKLLIQLTLEGSHLGAYSHPSTARASDRPCLHIQRSVRPLGWWRAGFRFVHPGHGLLYF